MDVFTRYTIHFCFDRLAFPPGVSFSNGTISGYSYVLFDSTSYTIKAVGTKTLSQAITLEVQCILNLCIEYQIDPVCESDGEWPETVSGTTAILGCSFIPIGQQYRDCIYDNNDCMSILLDSIIWDRYYNSLG